MPRPSDGVILHALQLHPRVSFRHIAEITGLSEQTVSRRYHQLRREGVLRVIGVVNAHLVGDIQWVARIRIRPDSVAPLTDALIRRPDVGYVSIQSGGTELFCTILTARDDPRNGALLQKLPRSAAVLDIGVDLVLHTFGDPTTTVWTGYGDKLSKTQARQIIADNDRKFPTDGPPAAPTTDDMHLLDVLSRDGRASQAELARATGWSVARVARRMAILEASRALRYDVDVLPEYLGFHINAILWLTLPPEHTDTVGTELATHDEIVFVAAITGPRNLMAVALCRDDEDLYHYLSGRFAAVGHIATYEISVRTQVLKHATSLVSHGRLVNASPRKPGT